MCIIIYYSHPKVEGNKKIQITAVRLPVVLQILNKCFSPTYSNIGTMVYLSIIIFNSKYFSNLLLESSPYYLYREKTVTVQLKYLYLNYLL